MSPVTADWHHHKSDLFLFFVFVVPGSYDHTLKVFDARAEKSAITMDHGQPVESLLLYPSEGLLVSAGCQPNHLAYLYKTN